MPVGSREQGLTFASKHIGETMKRREFVQAAGLGLAASAVAGQAIAQTVHCTASGVDNERGQVGGKAMAPSNAPKRVGFLLASTKRAWSDFIEEFRDALDEATTTRFKIIFSQPANANYINYPGEARRLLQNNQIQIIVTAGSEPLMALLGQMASLKPPPTTPIVVASAAMTRGVPKNVSGFLNGQVDSAAERFKKFKQYAGDLATMAILYNSGAENAVEEQQKVEAEAKMASVATTLVAISNGTSAFDVMTRITQLEASIKSLYVCTDPLLTMHRDTINAAAIQKQLPTMYQFRQHLEAGGLMSYGPNFTELFRGAASIVGSFLENESAVLPGLKSASVDQFEVVWNRSTARILNLHGKTGYIPPNFEADGGIVVD
jgi:putative ABC transport system substrate-binding protein